MPRQKRPLAEADGNATKPPAKRASKGSKAIPAPVTGLEFVTMCRPRDDVEDERKDKRPINADGFEGGESAGGFDLADVETDEEDSDEDEEEGGHANLVENRDPDGKCMCKKPAKDFPEWKWVVSKRALDTMIFDLKKEFWKRDQDAHRRYHCNDWTGYGMQEVMENQAGVLAICSRVMLTDPAARYRQGYCKEQPLCSVATYRGAGHFCGRQPRGVVDV